MLGILSSEIATQTNARTEVASAFWRKAAIYAQAEFILLRLRPVAHWPTAMPNFILTIRPKGTQLEAKMSEYPQKNLACGDLANRRLQPLGHSSV
jgi:hypothetical protein